jgi:predicted PurR-regulated permease PerM
VVIQQIDGNIIQPKIVGDKVGLEPLWVITAVIVFGSYWGITGMLVAVPFTALIKTILRKAIARRREVVYTIHDNKTDGSGK